MLQKLSTATRMFDKMEPNKQPWGLQSISADRELVFIMDWTHTWFGVQGKGREKGPKFSKSRLPQMSNKGKLFGLCVLHIYWQQRMYFFL